MTSSLLFISISILGVAQAGLSTFATMFIRIEFGLKSLGKLLGLLYIANAFGVIVISNLLFLSFYSSENNESCYGSSCFRGAYIINTVLAFISIILSLILYRWFRNKYFKKLRSEINTLVEMKEKTNEIKKEVAEPQQEMSIEINKNEILENK